MQLITSGRLPKDRLKDYAVLRWPFQARADLAMMISHVAYLEGDDAHHLLENAFDEILRPAGEGDHPGLWVQFARRLGRPRPSWTRRPPTLSPRWPGSP